MKRKKPIIISSLLLLLSIVLLVLLTLSWFFESAHEVGRIDLYYPGMYFEFQHTVDENGDGVPDEDEDGNIIYIINNSNTITLDNYFPMCEKRFRLVSEGVSTGGKYFLKFTEIHWDGPDNSDIDVSEAFEIEFVPPGETDPVTLVFSDEMNGEDSFIVFEGYDVGENIGYTFDYTIRMRAEAGNEYKNHRLVVGKVIFGAIYG